MGKSTVRSHFEIHEVVALTGFTKYMLDYLTREDIFAPSGYVQGRRGLRRRYDYADVVLLRALHSICASKGKIRHLKDALRSFREQFGPMKVGQRLDKQLFVVGNELCIYTAAEGGRTLQQGQLTFSFVVDFSRVTNEVADCVVVKPRSEEFRLSTAAAHKAEQERQRIWAPVKARRALVR